MRLRIALTVTALSVLILVAAGAVVLLRAQATPQPASPTPAATIAGQEPPGTDEGVTAVYRRVGPAVLNITSSTTAVDPFFGQEMPEQGTGSGVIIDDQGNILTNNHVVAGAGRLEVALADGTKVPAQVVGRDPGNDLAVIRASIPKEKLAVAPLGRSSGLQVGESVVAIGNPFGLDQTATHGIISATGRRLPQSGARALANLIQTDAAINPGNSGGPLLNLRGEVIGINTAIQNPTGERVFVGVGFAIPIDTAKRFLPDMLAGKTVEHPWLGLSGLQITPERAKELGLSVQEGVLVLQAVRGGPAVQAGLRGGGTATPAGGDIITSVDGRAVRKVEDLVDYVDTKSVGDTVTLTILRSGARQTLSVRLGAWPEELP